VAGYEVPGINGFNADQNKRLPYDPEAAKKLLADAGYQASWRCQLVIDPARRRVEMLYDSRRLARPAARGRRRR